MTPSRTPHEYPRRVLLAVAGTTPQILTETIYALSQAKPPFVPTEVHVVTTSEGAHRIHLQLLDEKTGKFHALCRDYKLRDITFTASHIKVLIDSQGNPLQDIVSPQDNEQAADQIVAWLRGFTQDADCAIHACLAGGRKTMGFYLGYGLSLFGREQDRLSHVLVSPEFESHREFFYKPPKAQTLYGRSMVGAMVDERPISTADAKIWLAVIPFVRLRDGLPEALLGGKDSYTDAVQAVQQSLPNNKLVIDIPDRQIICGGIPVKLSPRDMAFYVWHVQRHIELGEAAPLTWKNTMSENNPITAAYLACYLRVLSDDKWHTDYKTAQRNLANGFDKDTWAGYLNPVNKKITHALGEARAQPFKLNSQRLEKSSRLSLYGLHYPVAQIEFIKHK
ncbi:MAG: CRISPR-associated ring nuclease Csm6 [Gallionella sp.]|nr:TIGR02584 family CRISPR-associated protein [Gallionella sp.]